jgi:hypothetical protein
MHRGFVKYILGSILCVSLFSTSTYALDRNRPLPELLRNTYDQDNPDYPQDCNETPCQQACNENYQACMDYADILNDYCDLIPVGPARDACNRASRIVRDACLIARDACNVACLEAQSD